MNVTTTRKYVYNLNYVSLNLFIWLKYVSNLKGDIFYGP